MSVSQVLARQVAIKAGSDSVDHRRICLQPHPLLQPPRETPGNARALVRTSRFLFDNRGQYQRFVGRLDGRLSPGLPLLGQHFLHQLIGLAE